MQEWYLLTPSTRPNITGGYENNSLVDYKDDAFYEVLQTDIATTVKLYNSDLSVSNEIRCIIQGNTADTRLNSIERIGLFICGTVKAGMYIFFEDSYWLITGYPGTNGIYEKATMVLCQYKLRWQNSSNNIVERWCNGTSASKYDVGESGNNTITLSSNTFSLLLPGDEEVIELDGKRVFIDRHNMNPTKVYKVTRSDDISFDYGEKHGSVLNFIADKKEFNPFTDNQELRICDYHSPATPSSPDIVSILGGTILKCGRAKTWTVKFTDGEGNEIANSDFNWNTISNFDIKQTITNNKIQIKVDNDSLIGESFLLQVINPVNEVLKEIKIMIIEEF